MQVTDRVKAQFLVNLPAIPLPLPYDAKRLALECPLIAFGKKHYPVLFKIGIGHLGFAFPGQFLYPFPESLVAGNNMGLPVHRPDQIAGIINDRPKVLPVVIDLFLDFFLLRNIHEIYLDTIFCRVYIHRTPHAQRCI